MGLILDFAVVALAVVVIGSLALLAWTLAVSAVRATDRGQAVVAEARGAVAEADARVGTALPAAAARLTRLTRRIGRRTTDRWTDDHPGDDPDA